MRYGIDVSHYQGNVDWSKVKASGKVSFAIMKAMYESTKAKDETFEANYTGCSNNNINRGIYNYVGFESARDAVADAKAILKILSDRKLEYGIWLDLESKNLRELGSLKIEEVVLDETKLYEEAGYSVGIYCSMDWYNNVLTSAIKKRFNGKIWIARYSSSDDGTVPENLNPKDKCPECIGWQYSPRGRISGIDTVVDLDMFWGELDSDITTSHTYARADIVNKCEEWLGKNTADNSYCEILNIYNSVSPLPRGYAIKPNDAWCAAFASAVFTDCGYKDIFPVECSCNKMLEKAKEMGIWIEDDNFIPNIGDAVLYDWQDNGVSDNTGLPDHVGIVTYVNSDSGYMVVTEGNYDNAVKKRTINLNGKYIRGFITPKFTNVGRAKDSDESKKSYKEIAYDVIAGKYGNGEERRKRLESLGYEYSTIQQTVNEILNTPKKVNIPSSNKKVVATAKAQKVDRNIAGKYITTTNLYLRDGAGTNKKALAIIPVGLDVQCYGYYSVANGLKWYYIVATINGVEYTGFSSCSYLRRQ